MNARRFLLIAAFLCVGPVSAGSSAADFDVATHAVSQARDLLDTYYENPAILRRAGDLLDKALAADPRNADAYVEAARLTVKGGHLVRDQFRPNTVETHHALLDKALTLDPKNQKAFMLKAEAYDIQKAYPQEKLALDKARELGPTGPWLLYGYGQYAYGVRDDASAHYFFSKVEALGPGSSRRRDWGLIAQKYWAASKTPVSKSSS